MTYTITEDHIRSLNELGFVILRQIISAELLTKLRWMADTGRAIARKDQYGNRAQRINPERFVSELDVTPYQEFRSVPHILQAVETLLGDGYDFGFDVQRHPIAHFPTCLYEPQIAPWTTHWHRDWRDNALHGLRQETEWMEKWHRLRYDHRLFNQFNAPLYDDTSLWIVPGSHARDDLPEETAAVTEGERLLDRQDRLLAENNTDRETIEYLGKEYCQIMPRSVSPNVHAGDIMIYRNGLWHLGSYVPYRRRATLHDGIMTDEFYAWFAEYLQDTVEKT